MPQPYLKIFASLCLTLTVSSSLPHSTHAHSLWISLTLTVSLHARSVFFFFFPLSRSCPFCFNGFINHQVWNLFSFFLCFWFLINWFWIFEIWFFYFYFFFQCLDLALSTSVASLIIRYWTDFPFSSAFDFWLLDSKFLKSRFFFLWSQSRPLGPSSMLCFIKYCAIKRTLKLSSCLFKIFLLFKCNDLIYLVLYLKLICYLDVMNLFIYFPFGYGWKKPASSILRFPSSSFFFFFF